MSEATGYMSVHDFLAGERVAEVRHEFVGGRAYAMAGATERHELAATLLSRRIIDGALAPGCRPFTANRLVETPPGSMYYPDVMVACGKASDQMYESYPTLIIEVLSPSTVAVDRREKALAYTAIKTLKMLLLVGPEKRRLLVGPEKRRIEAAWLDDDRSLVWDVFVPGDVVITGYGEIDVERFYDELDATATT